jgi:hypothetical protein
MKINVIKIDETWSTCSYKFRVFVPCLEVGTFDYVLDTLKKWFGEAEFFWTSPREGHTMFLCGKK